MAETRNKVVWWLEAIRTIIAAVAGLLASQV